jgi:hypothetical protein
MSYSRRHRAAEVHGAGRWDDEAPGDVDHKGVDALLGDVLRLP